jgi:hypothetical protein
MKNRIHKPSPFEKPPDLFREDSFQKANITDTFESSKVTRKKTSQALFFYDLKYFLS